MSQFSSLYVKGYWILKHSLYLCSAVSKLERVFIITNVTGKLYEYIKPATAVPKPSYFV